MAFNGDWRHLTSEQIQEFLDQGLTPMEEAQVREHLSVCPGCRSEAEAWNVLFAELGSLPELEPGTAFSQRVLGELPVPAQDARGWLTARKARRSEDAHVPAGSLQDYLEGLLAPRPAARLESHLAACSTCRHEAGEWSAALDTLRTLGRFAPASGFAERVMAGVRIPSQMPAPRWSSLPARGLAWARSLLPKTRRGWAVAGGMASAPTITGVTLLYMVFSRPQLTAGSFLSYAFWKISAFLDSLFSTVTTSVVESELLFQLYSFFQPLALSPLMVGVGGLILSLLGAGALWVLYRNLIVAPSDERYARAQL